MHSARFLTSLTPLKEVMRYHMISSHSCNNVVWDMMLSIFGCPESGCRVTGAPHCAQENRNRHSIDGVAVKTLRRCSGCARVEELEESQGDAGQLRVAEEDLHTDTFLCIRTKPSASSHVTCMSLRPETCPARVCSTYEYMKGPYSPYK